jgi:exonuclease VII large subunit
MHSVSRALQNKDRQIRAMSSEIRQLTAELPGAVADACAVEVRRLRAELQRTRCKLSQAERNDMESHRRRVAELDVSIHAIAHSQVLTSRQLRVDQLQSALEPGSTAATAAAARQVTNLTAE